MKRFSFISFSLSAALFGTSVIAAQTCEGTDSTAGEDMFTVSTSVPAKVYHTTSGLEWSRCVVGQTWNNGNHTDWRVPNLKELVSLVERACVEPAIELKVFPTTPSNSYWTSTPNTSADKTQEAWSVGFYNGRIESRDKQQDFYVRMVRYAE